MYGVFFSRDKQYMVAQNFTSSKATSNICLRIFNHSLKEETVLHRMHSVGGLFWRSALWKYPRSFLIKNTGQYVEFYALKLSLRSADSIKLIIWGVFGGDLNFGPVTWSYKQIYL